MKDMHFMALYPKIIKGISNAIGATVESLDMRPKNGAFDGRTTDGASVEGELEFQPNGVKVSVTYLGTPHEFTIVG